MIDKYALLSKKMNSSVCKINSPTERGASSEQ